MTFRAAILSCSALALVPATAAEETEKPWSQADAIWGEEAMAEARAQASINVPLLPVYANVLAAPIASPDEIRARLVEQVTGRVRWRESAIAMAEAGTDHFVELGGKVVGPMVKKVAGEATIDSVVTMDDVEALLKAL